MHIMKSNIQKQQQDFFLLGGEKCFGLSSCPPSTAPANIPINLALSVGVTDKEERWSYTEVPNIGRWEHGGFFRFTFLESFATERWNFTLDARLHQTVMRIVAYLLQRSASGLVGGLARDLVR